jgi:hypothetical protein
MNIDQRLRAAAAELSGRARQSTPPPLGRSASGTSAWWTNGWLAFAATFAIVLAVIGIPLLIGGFGVGPSDGGPVGTGETITTQGPTSTTPPAANCEVSELYPPTTVGYTDDSSGPLDTTEPVRDKLTAIAAASQECDQAALADLAADGFTTSFGGGSGIDDLVRMHEEGVEVYRIIGDLLNMSHGVVEMEGGERLFVWPAAFAYDAWAEIPAENIAELSLLYSQEEIDQLEDFGVYAGWRMGITESGQWIFFVAGD